MKSGITVFVLIISLGTVPLLQSQIMSADKMKDMHTQCDGMQSVSKLLPCCIISAEDISESKYNDNLIIPSPVLAAADILSINTESFQIKKESGPVLSQTSVIQSTSTRLNC